MAKNKKRKSKIVVPTAKISRAWRDSKWRRTKFYRPYKPRAKSTKKRKPNLYIEFRTCFAKELRDRNLKPGQLESVEGVKNFKSLSTVVAYVWARLAKEEKKNSKYLCANTNLVFERFFVKKPSRDQDLVELTRLYDASVWWHVHDEFIPELFKTVIFKPGDRVFLSGYVNGNIKFFDGKWIEFLKDGVTASMFYQTGNSIFNKREYKDIFTSPVPELSLIDYEITPKNTINLFYQLTSQHGETTIKGVNPNADMSRDDTLEIKEQGKEPEITKATEPSKPTPETQTLSIEKEKTLQEVEKTKQKKLDMLDKFMSQGHTGQEIIDFTKALGF